MQGYNVIQFSRVLAEKTLQVGVFNSWPIAIASIVSVLLGAIATSAGIGGGGLFVPLYALVLGYGVKGAVPLSAATILGGALGKYLSTSKGKHPKADRPIIDYNLATMIQSWELLGTVFGVIFNLIFPELLIVILLVIILGLSSFKTFRKGMQFYRKENALKIASKKAQEIDPEDGSIMNAISNVEIEEKESSEERKMDILAPQPEADKPESAEILAEKKMETIRFPRWQLASLFIMTVFIIIYALVKKGVIGDLHSCSAGYWVWYFVPVPFFVCLGSLVAYKLLQTGKRKEAMSYVYLEGDLKWNVNTVKKIPMIGVVAGTAASLVGIGGGMIVVPLFLELEVLPEVASSTNAFIIVFVGMSSVVQYSVIEVLPWDYALWFISIGFIGAQLGHHSLKRILERTGRSSIICFILAGFIAASVLVMFIDGIISVASTSAGEIFKFSTNELCGSR
mmetsp:Transcript_35998/g.45832  ORF Transcript_35998/g.45832 Transcript_35998/m.45832 type:complete len:453 (+) Transcript_35998:252-1610(+)